MDKVATIDQAATDAAKQVKAKQYIFKLTNSQRCRMLTQAQAKGLNVSLKDRGSADRWVNDPTLTMAELTEDSLDDQYVPNHAEVLRNSTRKQHARDLLTASAKETTVKTATRTETQGYRKAKRLPGRDDDDNEYRGLSMCQIIRFAGLKGANRDQARQIAQRAGFVPADGTLTIQLGRGRKGEKVPNVSKELAAELLADILPPPGSKAKVKKQRTPEEIAARKARKAAKRAKAHKTAGHEVKAD